MVLCDISSKRLTGHSNMAVSFALINHIHNLIRAGDKTLSTSLRREERGEEKGITNIMNLIQPRERISPKKTCKQIKRHFHKP